MRPQHDPEADQRASELDEAAFDGHSRDRDQCRHDNADGQHGGKGQGRKVDDQDSEVDRELQEGIFLQTRRAEIEAGHRERRNPHRGQRMIDQPTVKARRQRSGAVADRTQQRPAERNEHERSCRQRVDREHERLAIGDTSAIHDSLRQQQQRRIGFLDLDRMLVGDPSGDREQPAREQVRIEHNRDQNRQRETETRHSHQDKFPPSR
ncbi:hypothetical protein [Bradyrhizobium sp. CCBAU 51627]|uniref:hypothetical protein n=1 Tax=Bradyrhizobium sp. CCBAU 51627 TaxID=1325088 RepID=UPI002306B355|nr:hypothetical protein [Bradyrhizobium sp. CCBAU 51627]